VISTLARWTKKCFFITFVASCAGCAGLPLHLAHRYTKNPVDSVKRMRAENYFIKAREFEMLGLSKKALYCYEAAYAFDPQSNTLRDLLIEKYIELSQYSRALILIKGNKKTEKFSDDDKRLWARIYLKQGKIGLLTATLESIKEKQAEEFHTLGLVYESQGNIAKAAGFYKGCLKKKPESPHLWLKTAGLLTTLKRYDEAESLFIEMEHRFGQAPELLNGIGLIKLAKGDTALAINSFKMASLLDSSFEEGNKNIAKIYIQKGNWEQAIPYYEKLYVGGSKNDSYGKTLAMLNYYSKNYAKAWTLLSGLITENDTNVELHFYGGLALAAMDSGGLARAEFEKVIALRPDFSEAWQQLCFLATKEKEYDRALSTANNFRTVMPHSAVAWRMSGYIYNARKEYTSALPFLAKALKIDSTDALAWFEFGTSLERTQDKKKAVLAFKRVLSLRPDDPVAANYLAYMWAEQGVNLDSARTLLTMALRQDSLNGAYLDSYAWIYYKMGFLDTANAYIVKALSHLDDDPIVYTHYGDILIKKGNYSDALAAYKNGLKFAVPDKASIEEINDLKNKIRGVEILLKSQDAKPSSPHDKSAP
jgi:tetratricopeptide (TPR) repeat protein